MMPDAKREKKIAAAKRKLRQFKQKREKDINTKSFKDDVSSVASEDTEDANVFKEQSADNLSTTTFQPDLDTNFSINEQDRTSNVCNQDTITVESNSVETQPDIVPVVENGLDIPFNQLKHDVHEPKAGDVETVSEISNLHATESHIESSVKENEALFNKTDVNKVQDSGDFFPDSRKIVLHHLQDPSTDSSDSIPTTDANIEKNDELNGNEEEPKGQNNNDLSVTTTAEKILQISSKLNGLAAEANAVMSSNDGSNPTTADQYVLSELEQRNQQLAEQVAALTRQKQELVLQIEKLTQQMTELHHRLESEKQQIYSHGINEQNTLRQQLQVQMQTIGILVAEKQELQHQIHEARASATQEQNSRQRSQDQLQDAKLRLQALERESVNNEETIAMLSSAKSELTEERDRLQTSLKKTTKSYDESTMQANELGRKLANKDQECQKLSTELDDLHEKLSMAEVLLQQLSNSSGATTENQLQQLQEDRESLNQKLIEYQQAFEQLTGEREQLSRQYEDMSAQMQTQVTELSQQVDLLENEKSDLQIQLETCLGKIQELESQNTAMTLKSESNKNENLTVELTSKLQEINVALARVTEERDEVNNKLQVQLRNNEHLARLNEEKESQLTEMGRNISDNVVSAEEHTKLLEQSQSDKATISRALIQNKQLKQHLEEMQDGFVKLSNDKMELATELATTSHARKDLEDEVAKCRLTLATIEEQMQSKDKDISKLESTLKETESSLVEQPHPSIDEASFINVQSELKTSQETVAILGEQNNQLKLMISNLQSDFDATNQTNVAKEKKDGVAAIMVESEVQVDTVQENTNVVDELNDSIRHLEEERSSLLHNYNEQRRQHDDLMDQFLRLQQNSKDSESVSVEEHMELLHNMSLLQDRFAAVMKDKVEAMTRAEELEHVNLQLQNECDTIGEYITLYHNQRQILKQRHHEKDEYVSSMAQEREQMQLKLEKLQSLVLSLLNSRGINNDPSSSPLASSSPREDGQMKDALLAGLGSEWPDMLEDEEGPHDRKPRPDLLPETASLPLHDERNSVDDQPAILKPSEPTPGKLQRIEGEAPPDNETNTASQIINLLEQMQKPGVTNTNDIPQGFGLHYMGPYTAI